MKGIPRGVKIPSICPANEQLLLYLEPDADHFSAAPSLVKPQGVKPDHVFRIGRVVRKGPGKWAAKGGKRIEIPVEVGARVLFIKFVATHTKTAESVQQVVGNDFALVRSSDLLLEVDDDANLEYFSQ